MEPDIYRAVVDLCLLLFLAQLSAEVAERLRMPRILGVLIAGGIFGPNLLGGFMAGGRPLIEFNDLIFIFAEFGAILVLFTAGFEITFDQFRNVGKYCFTIGAVDIVFSFSLAFVFMWVMGFDWVSSMVVAGALAPTSIAVSTVALKQLGKMGTQEAKFIINAAVIDDILSMTILTVILAYVREGAAMGPLQIAQFVGSSLVKWYLILLVGVYTIPMLLNRAEGLSEGILESAAILVCFGAASVASAAGLSPLIGAFSAGMAIASTRSRAKIEGFVSNIESIFVPVFFMVMGAGIDPNAFLRSDLLLLVAAILVAILSKLIGCGAPAAYLTGDSEQGLRVGIGMISRGEIGFVIANMGFRNGIITSELYTMLIAVNAVTIFITPLLIRKSYEAQRFMKFFNRLTGGFNGLRPGPLMKRMKK